MSTLPPELRKDVEQLRERLAEGLPPAIAKLYSQYTRIREVQPGLTSWNNAEAEARFDEAILLLDAALTEREAMREQRGEASYQTQINEGWRSSARRAAEMIEWLSQPDVFKSVAPLRLLAAAAYQLAGYPARASGVLRDTADDHESLIVRAFLQADFVALFHHLVQYWADTVMNPQNRSAEPVGALQPPDIHGIISTEAAAVFGVLSAAMRWGDDIRVEPALKKLSAIASLMLHGQDRYSWLLARLCVEIAQVYLSSTLRLQSAPLFQQLGPTGQAAFERYLRINYLGGKALCWPSQARGIRRLLQAGPFVLCTPTGSGKTTVAELAILASLFAPEQGGDAEIFGPLDRAPLVLYLVPSRALAAEVESKLSKVVRNLEDPKITVTGLYGGTDWGPTDAWLTNNERVVLIATYEKAEALVRFLGIYFLRRVSLVILDEAHGVQFDGTTGSYFTENRALRRESLGARLFAHLDPSKSRVIALSAVAKGIETALAEWISGQKDIAAESISYRSTRQIIGRLICLHNRTFQIHYDILDGEQLIYEDAERTLSPYIPNPFPAHPPAPDWAREKQMERRLIPALLWAAMHLAAPDAEGIQRGVLVSIPQAPQVYAEGFLKLLDEVWAAVRRPPFFTEPTEGEQFVLWKTCLRACADYFGEDSYEYRLLKHGIAFHHGKMPGSLARLLVNVINGGIIHLVAATSTLSEGVNLPFETILMTSLKRFNSNTKKPEDIPLQEFANLIGRAGRPGQGTEGRTLILLENTGAGASRVRWDSKDAFERYRRMAGGLLTRSNTLAPEIEPSSALAQLLVAIQQTWQRIAGEQPANSFQSWLEQTSPEVLQAPQADDEIHTLGMNLDTLDSILLSAIVEVEELAQRTEQTAPASIEAELQRIWQRTYARYAAKQEEYLSSIFITRGTALTRTIYPNRSYRRRLYRTGLNPQAARTLLNLYSELLNHLQTGTNYALWTPHDRISYITQAAELLSRIPTFTFGQRAGMKKVDWRNILGWWLSPNTAAKTPDVQDRAAWHSYVSTNFTYRFNWGLGSFIALAMEEAFGESRPEPSLDQWPQLGLPWIVFWLKELTTWGTLDPVAALLLSQNVEQTRPDAEEQSRLYYQIYDDQFTDIPRTAGVPPDEIYNASSIREWCLQAAQDNRPEQAIIPPRSIRATWVRESKGVSPRRWRVLPVIIGEKLRWMDPAGFELALSPKPEVWHEWFMDRFDFELDLDASVILWTNYVSIRRPPQPRGGAKQ